MKKVKWIVISSILLFTIGGILLVFNNMEKKETMAEKEILATISSVEINSSHVSKPERNLWDGNMKESFWSSSGSEQNDELVTVKINLAQKYDVCKVELYPCIIEKEVCYFPQVFTISVSSDGEGWTQVYETENYKVRDAEKQEITFEVQKEIQYIRLQMKPVKEDRANDAFYVRLSEVVVFGIRTEVEN